MKDREQIHMHVAVVGVVAVVVIVACRNNGSWGRCRCGSCSYGSSDCSICCRSNNRCRCRRNRHSSHCRYHRPHCPLISNAFNAASPCSGKKIGNIK